MKGELDEGRQSGKEGREEERGKCEWMTKIEVCCWMGWVVGKKGLRKVTMGERGRRVARHFWVLAERVEKRRTEEDGESHCPRF